MKILIPFFTVLLLFSCSPDKIESQAENIDNFEFRAHVPDNCIGMEVHIYYDPALVPYEEVRNIRNQYFTQFSAWLCFPSEQPSYHYHDIWYYLPGTPEGDGSVGGVIDEDPRVGTTPPLNNGG